MAFGDDMIDGYPEGEEPLVFHHKNGGFRERESQVYRDLATGKNQPKKGLFRVLVSTKMNRMIFFAMIMTFGVVLAVSLLGGKANEGLVNGVYCSLNAFSFGDDVYVSVSMRRSSAKKSAEIKGQRVVHYKVVAVNSDEADADVQEQDVVFTDSGDEENARFVFKNYEITKINAGLSSGEETLNLTCKVQAR
ncbi:MAG TPA: hypothetical protein DEO40_00310 [Treponema sp.]|jgi:hypothetical protein|nr:hypothetical protein [Treponema sp.]HAK68881.1 hypothetical protein [Treponema sp.]HBB42509.1 hypothetical protein [Treponema sp.]HCA19102.1 hypothetical protein [Treponema sp.]